MSTGILNKKTNRYRYAIAMGDGISCLAFKLRISEAETLYWLR
jgi:hypothetical protein